MVTLTRPLQSLSQIDVVTRYYPVGGAVSSMHILSICHYNRRSSHCCREIRITG